VRYLAELEATTTAGRTNILGMLLSLILAISLSLAPLFETLVRLIHPGEEMGAPLLQIFVAFLVFTLLCTGMLAYAEAGSANQRARSSTSEDISKPRADKSKTHKKVTKKTKQKSKST
jgi:Co/Zn/Cd efflux system component